MTSGIGYSRRVVAEVEEIMAFLAETSPSAAQRFSEAMGRAEQQLSQFPNSGVSGLRPGTRRLIVGAYILSYRRRGAGIEIFAVRHASRRDARL